MCDDIHYFCGANSIKSDNLNAKHNTCMEIFTSASQLRNVIFTNKFLEYHFYKIQFNYPQLHKSFMSFKDTCKFFLHKELTKVPACRNLYCLYMHPPLFDNSISDGSALLSISLIEKR